MATRSLQPAASPDAGDHIASVATACGNLAVGCMEAVDAIAGTSAGVARQLSNLGSIESIIRGLEVRQDEAARASGLARTLSATARKKLHAGSTLIDGAIGEVEALTDLVSRMGLQVTAFAAAMEQVRGVAASIETITRTTRMLALNAAIEAQRAGETGATFAVVADEVNKLAQDTRVAVNEIGRTVASLDQEATALAGDIVAGVAQANAARSTFVAVQDTSREVLEIVCKVDTHNEGIAVAARSIHAEASGVRSQLATFADEAHAAEDLLDEARARVEEVELVANGMFDRIVHSGLAVDDQRFVDMTLAGAAEATAIIERAMGRGDIVQEAVFDTQYRPIAGSDPARYDTQFSSFADAALRPLLDRTAAGHSRIISVVCSDVNGYLPTHTSRFSQKPKPGDAGWNRANCRNRMIILDEPTARAITSEAPFMMGVYRFDLGETAAVLRNVWVPIRVNGRRWGNFEIAYRDAA